MGKYDFKLISDEGKMVSLADFKGKNVVVYFYPKDNTSGWTIEANGFRDLNQEFEKLNTVIIGISKDSQESHQKFKRKNELNFILLTDDTGEVLEKYGVLKNKKMFGKEVLGIERSTFVFNKFGELVKEFRNVKPGPHPQEVLEFIKENLAYWLFK